MNDALNYYKDINRVISIHGYVYPLKARLPETFFLKDTGCWGWATWKRGWKLFERDGSLLLNEIRERRLSTDFDFQNSYPFTRMLEKQTRGLVGSWAIRWQASAFLHNKLTLYPGRSLVLPIGHDGTGTNNPSTRQYDVVLCDNPVKISAILLAENKAVREKYISYFRLIMSLKTRLFFYLKLLNIYIDGLRQKLLSK